MTYFDSHAHYFDERFVRETDGGPDALLDELLSTSVSHVINVATSPDNATLAIAQAARHPTVYTALGIHPTDGQDIDDPDAQLAVLRTRILDPAAKCVALGEIGLDYHYPDADRCRQLYLFEAQMTLARELGLPVVIHDRDAHEDVMSVLRSFPDVHGVMHSFSGSPEMATELVRRGYYISFSGTLTFKNARRPVETAVAVPKDRILIETDAPYLAPHPFRGQLNHSGRLAYTCRRLAELLGLEEEACAALTTENACRLFRIAQ